MQGVNKVVFIISERPTLLKTFSTYHKRSIKIQNLPQYEEFVRSHAHFCGSGDNAHLNETEKARSFMLSASL